MLIDFTVSNFRSIRDPVTLSLIETAPRKSRQKGSTRKRKRKTDDEIAPALDVPGWDFKLLRSACIMGANASGKSNIVRALVLLQDLLSSGARRHEMDEQVIPFRLDPACAEEPTCFRFRVANRVDERTVVYVYDLRLRGDLIVSEQLDMELPDASRMLFKRDLDEQGERRAVLDKQLPAAIKEIEAALAPAVPLLHVLANNFQLKWMAGLRWWLATSRGFSESSQFVAGILTSLRMLDAAFAKRVAAFVREQDTMISDIRVEQDEGARIPRLRAIHATPQGEVAWDLKEESAGTQRLVRYAGPILQALESGGLLVLDEFGSHLHPHITERIVQLFHSPTTNPQGAQLVFNTHSAHLLQDQQLRRDQVWFTEKRPDGSTDLFSMSEFKLRNDKSMAKAYLGGSLGAVPVLPPAPDAIAAAQAEGGP